MSRASRRLSILALVSTGLTAVGLPVLATDAGANPDGTGLVINEVYGGGGNSGGAFRNDFVELYNPSNEPIILSEMSLQYRSAGGTGAPASSNVLPLTGTVPAKGTFLVQLAVGNDKTQPALPTPDATGTIALSGSGGQIFLAQGTAPLDPGTGSVAGKAGIVDFVGWGSTTATFETATAPGTSNSTSVARKTVGADTDVNRDDFATGAPTPQASGGGSTPTDPPAPEPSTVPIAEIQGTGATSPLAGKTVTTTGVVTASYPTGGFKGFYLQTGGTGSGTDATPGASDAIFVYGQGAVDANAKVGETVTVTGAVSEYQGLTELTPANASDVKQATTAQPAVTPLSTAWWTTDAEREAHEGELLAPTGSYTVSNNYATNQFGEIGLAAGTTPLRQPTDVARPGSAEAAAVAKDNAERAVTVDDGASINFTSGANRDIPLPWLEPESSIRTGATGQFSKPVVLDYRFNAWRFQPQEQLTDEGVAPITFPDTRASSAAWGGVKRDVGGDVKLATFNVLNYFTWTGTDHEAAGSTCSYYTDRQGNRTTVNTCSNNGPRGAAEDDDLARQQEKIVAAINGSGANVVSLEELENSVKFGLDRDDAVKTLVAALNAKAGDGTWAYVPSPAAADLPPVDQQDVIRTGFIYQPAKVTPVGGSKVLVGSSAFTNARQPLAQAFKEKGARDADAFVVVVNHFKSKGGTGTGDNLDTGDGQGSWNGDRTRQAEALATFADDFAKARNTDRVFLVGDFNSYTMEDPMQVLYGKGYSAVKSDQAEERTYVFSGLVGSLDHVLASPSAKAMVIGADVWNINSVESVAYEYSRHNNNVEDFHAPNEFRSSDHDPEIVGLDTPSSKQAATVTGKVDPASVVAGAGRVKVTATVAGGDGATPTGKVEVRDGARVLGTIELTNGTGSVNVGPFGIIGARTLTLVYLGDSATESGATSTVDVTVTGKQAASILVSVAAGKIVAGADKAKVSVTVKGADGLVPTGEVEVRDSRKLIGTIPLQDGSGSIELGPFETAGLHTLHLTYVGDAQTQGASAPAGLWIAAGEVTTRKTTTRTAVTHTPVRPRYGRDKVAMTTTVSATGATPRGRVEIVRGGAVVGTGWLKDGKVKIWVRPFWKIGNVAVTVRYLGNSQFEASSTVRTVTVVR